MSVVFRAGRPYLYRSVRRGGRVTSEYVASGREAVELARERARERGIGDDESPAARAQRLADEVGEAALGDFFGRVEDLARSLLHAAGFHRPTRGQWRRRHARRQPH